MSTLPRVVIVGRMNVGKSTLFNRLSTDVKSMALDYQGVTRDFLKDTVCWKDRCFELVDSGGISVHKLPDELGERVRLLGFTLVEKADLIMFVVDGTVGLTNDDQQLISAIRKKGKPVILVINKIDSKKTEEHAYEWQSVGIEHQFGISAQHGMGVAELLDGILGLLPAQGAYQEEKPAYQVVLLGKPNVGKSSLMNLMLKQERTLVSPIPGTTREAISEPIRFYQETINMTDTPGIRKKRSVSESLEQMMVKSSFRAVENADIILLMVDGSEGQLSDQELKLAFYCFEQGKAIIILFNKDDLMTDIHRADLKFDLEKYTHFIDKVPLLSISCKTGKNIGKIMPLVHEVWQRYNYQFDDVKLDLMLKAALKKTPLYHQSEMLVLLQAKQVKAAPITILLRVNKPDWFGPSQCAFLENNLRAQVDLSGVPVMFVTRKGS
jgi:GTP-binding protein